MRTRRLRVDDSSQLSSGATDTPAVGTVSGANGTFTVSGTHTFARAGAYKVQVTVKLTQPGMANVVVNGTAMVIAPSKRVPLARPARVPRIVRKRVAVVRPRGRNA